MVLVHSVISCGGVEYVSDGGGRGSEGNKGNEARPSLSDVMRYEQKMYFKFKFFLFRALGNYITTLLCIVTLH